MAEDQQDRGAGKGSVQSQRRLRAHEKPTKAPRVTQPDPEADEQCQGEVGGQPEASSDDPRKVTIVDHRGGELGGAVAAGRGDYEDDKSG